MDVDVSRFLTDLGLSKYIRIFAENEIEFGLLPHLNEENLKELGLPLGPRKKLHAAISELASSDPESSASKTFRREAERRQLTVAFVDLVGSTALSRRHDPEEMRDILRHYQDAVARISLLHHGHLGRFVGDGVVLYFGYPNAHEDDVECSVRAGLEIAQTIEKLEPIPGVSLSCRVGIATGQVVVGDLIGEGAAQEEAVTGVTPNLAARLQAVAEPGQVVVSHATHELVDTLFEFSDLGPQTLKGFDQAVGAWCAVRERSAQSRFEATHPSRLPEFVGREQEVALLRDQWQTASQGEGQLVMLSGEAGIGKSRILHAFREELVADSYNRIRLQCSPHHTSSALYPVIRQLTFSADIGSQESTTQKLAKLRRFLDLSPHATSEALSLIAALLSISEPESSALLNKSPKEQKHSTLNALVKQLQQMANTKPVLFVVEDAHWIDPTTTELLTLIAHASAQLPVLLVVTFRPEFECPWTSFANATSLALSRLTRLQTESLAKNVARDKHLPAGLIDQIVAKTDGVPLFVEELTKAVLEPGFESPGESKSRLSDPAFALAIPNTLQDSLMSRLDRFTRAKEIAQLAAVIGREFAFSLVAALSPQSAKQLQNSFSQLVKSGLIFRRGHPPKELYVFKHAMVQEAAYESLLVSKRRLLHRRIGKALEEEFSATQPEIIAHHYTRAGMTDRAVDFWKQAAETASARSADLEAVAHVNCALELISTLPKNGPRDELEFKLCIELARALIAAIGHAAPEVEGTVTRALKLQKKIGKTPLIFPVLFARYIFHYVSGPLSKAQELGAEIRRLAQTQQDPLPRLIGERTLAVCAIMTGDPVHAKAYTERALALYDPGLHRSMAYTYGQDGRIASLSFQVVSLWYSGFPDQARAQAKVALNEGRQLGHANTLGQTLAFAGALLPALCRDKRMLEQGVAELVALTAGRKLPFWEAFALAALGRLRFMQGRHEEAIEAIDKGIAGYEEQNIVRWRPMFYAWLAQAHAALGAHAEALKAIELARDLIDAYEERWFEPEVWRISGELRHDLGLCGFEGAKKLLLDAVRLANSREAKLLELRATKSYAKICLGRDHHGEAHAILNRIFNWFTEGQTIPDLVEAKRLLEKLS